MGSLLAEMVVKPTMSLKYSDTLSKYSGSTVPPTFRTSATDLGTIGSNALLCDIDAVVKAVVGV